MKRAYVVAAIVFATLAGVWHFWLGTPWTMRVSRNAVSSAKYFGTQTNADPVTGLLPKQDVLSGYERIIRVSDAADWPRSVVLRNAYTVRDVRTGAINFEYITTERIDPRTGAWFEGPHKGEIVLFPRNVEKRAYKMRSNYVLGLPLEFVGEEDVGGLPVYEFAYRGPIDLTASSGVTLPAGQEIRCADDQFYYRAWVEPRTGRIVQVEEGCMSGDFIYDKATGAKGVALDRWNGATSGSDLDAGISEAYNARFVYLCALYLPGLLFVGSIGALVFGFLRRNEPALA